MANTAALLDELGHEVVEIEPSWTNPALLPLFSIEFMGAIALSIGYSALIAGREPRREDMQALSWEIFQRTRTVSGLEVTGAHAQLQALMRAIVAELDPYDVVLTPALAQRPLPIGQLEHDHEERSMEALRRRRALHAVHRRAERDGPAGDLAARGDRRGRAARRGPAHRAPGGRGRAAVPRRADRAGTALGRPPAGWVGRI